MGMMGFPNEQELTSMLGYVTDEDRKRWEEMKATSDANLENARNGLTARGLASQAASPAISLAEKSVNAQMTSAAMEERRKTQVKQTKRTVTTFETEEPVKSDGHGLGY